MSKRICDICGLEKECKTFNKKQLQNKKKLITEEQTGETKDGTPIISKIIRWVSGKNTNSKLIEELTGKHNFVRKTRLCKNCITIFGI